MRDCEIKEGSVQCEPRRTPSQCPPQSVAVRENLGKKHHLLIDAIDDRLVLLGGIGRPPNPPGGDRTVNTGTYRKYNILMYIIIMC